VNVARECRDVFGIRRLLAQIGDSGDVSRVQPRHGRPRPRMASLSTLTATQLGPLGTREGCPLVPCPENSISGRIGERRILAEKLGFEIDSLYGGPPFYGSVSRPERHAPVASCARLISPRSPSTRSPTFKGRPRSSQHVALDSPRQPSGRTDFHVRYPDGSVISFVTYG
jgi:hypothetical protein